MKFWLFISIFLGFAAESQGQPEDKAVKKSKTQRIDLNEVDLERSETDWDSNSKGTESEVINSVRIKDIMEPSSEYNYASFGRPDPFIQPEYSPVNNDPVSLPIKDASGKDILVTSPLQAFPLNELSVKGIWQLASGDIRAVIATPKGEGVVVKEGDPISSGKVLSINRERLQVRLYRLRSDGVREYEDSTMKIGAQAKDEAKPTIRLDPGKDPMFPKAAEEKEKPAVGNVPNNDPAARALFELNNKANPLPGNGVQPQQLNAPQGTVAPVAGALPGTPGKNGGQALQVDPAMDLNGPVTGDPKGLMTTKGAAPVPPAAPRSQRPGAAP